MNLPNLSGILRSQTVVKIDFGRWQTIVAPAAAIFVSLVILISVIRPKFIDALRIRAQNQELETRVTNLGAKAQLLASQDKFLLDQQLSAAEAMLPSGEALFSFVRQVESVAATSGVILNKIDVGPSALASGTKQEAVTASKIQVKVAVTSDYRSLVTFLSQILSLPRANGIAELTISSSATGGEAGRLRTSMVIDAFWRSLPRDLGSIEAPLAQLTDEELEFLAKVQSATVSTPSLGGAVPQVPTGRSDLFAPF